MYLIMLFLQSVWEFHFHQNILVLLHYDTWACFETFTSATLLTNLGYPMMDLKLMVTRRQLMTLSDDETFGRE